ncbi:hypothetical protein [Shinella zoogloeoides]|uniref:hypothetical protein n=1 Tax=Shinella zoogloeoides TaxID=352475 RepID=UPI0028B1B996|nr:hypothetical protein [Shinella zoogloeoides]
MTIAELYAEWLSILEGPEDTRSDEEIEREPSRYQILQNLIVKAEPQTPQDVAMMYLADTDDGQSFRSEEFDARIRELAAQGVIAAPSSSPLDVLFERKHEADKLHDQQIKITDAYIEAGTATDEVWEAQFDACNVVDAIVLEICAYRPVNAAEQDRKARFLLEWTKATEASEDEVNALLQSMLLPTDGRASE